MSQGRPDGRAPGPGYYLLHRGGVVVFPRPSIRVPLSPCLPASTSRRSQTTSNRRAASALAIPQANFKSSCAGSSLGLKTEAMKMLAASASGAHTGWAPWPIDFQQQRLAISQRPCTVRNPGTVAIVEDPGVLETLMVRDHFLKALGADESVALPGSSLGRRLRVV